MSASTTATSSPTTWPTARSARSTAGVHLRLFDFSLSRVPLEQTKAGTPPYLDPFFDPVRRPRWDAAAERYAVAVTLFEMATGTVPVYGSGESHATAVDDEATVDVEMFDPAVADGLDTFFRKSLRRNPSDRFDTVADIAQARLRSPTTLRGCSAMRAVSCQRASWPGRCWPRRTRCLRPPAASSG